MQNIKENKRVIGEKSVWTTDDKDILIETTTTARIINLKELKDRKVQLESLISSQPSIEDVVAMENERLFRDREQLEIELESINKQLNG